MSYRPLYAPELETSQQLHKMGVIIPILEGNGVQRSRWPGRPHGFSAAEAGISNQPRASCSNAYVLPLPPNAQGALKTASPTPGVAGARPWTMSTTANMAVPEEGEPASPAAEPAPLHHNSFLQPRDIVKCFLSEL